MVLPTSFTCFQKQLDPCEENVSQRYKHMDLSLVPHRQIFLISQMLLDYPKRARSLAGSIKFCRFSPGLSGSTRIFPGRITALNSGFATSI